MKIISTRNSPIARKIKEVRDGKNQTLLMCEGAKLVDELLASPLKVHSLYIEKGKEKNLPSSIAMTPTVLSPSVMRFVPDLKTPPGVLALAYRPSRKEASQKRTAPLILILHELQLPQNVGAIIRTAEAAGVSEVWTTLKTADPFSPKALRGASGSSFRLKIRTHIDLSEALKTLKSQRIKAVPALSHGKIPYPEFNWTAPVALIMSSEGQGLSQAIAGHFSDSIRIPMAGKTESLNVAAATAVCLFEAARQRRTF